MHEEKESRGGGRGVGQWKNTNKSCELRLSDQVCMTGKAIAIEKMGEG